MRKTLSALVVLTACSGVALAASIPGVTVSTLLGSRVVGHISNQPGPQGKTVANPGTLSCGASSGICTKIYHAVSSLAKYKFTDLGHWPKQATFTVASAGPGTTSGTFTVDLNTINLHPGENLLITGDQYQRSGCTTLQGGSGKPLQLCPGQV